MSRKNTFGDSETDWQRIDTMRDEDIDLSDIPEVTEEQMAGARLRIGGRSVPRGKISVRLDAEVVAYFRMKAGEKKYESVINEILKAGIRDDVKTAV
ncbi:BrnA antitoxin family protein [Desulfobacterales bacterium HSG17]|nr:BrnA antitoxin family protein [Desulfobacterales bacterium HSG17]